MKRALAKEFSNVLVETVNVPGIDHLLVRELRIDVLNHPGGNRILFGNVDEIYIRMDFGADGDLEELWPWNEIISIATKQVERVRSVLSEGED
jgi:hypothetical protein